MFLLVFGKIELRFNLLNCIVNTGGEFFPTLRSQFYLKGITWG